MNFLYLFLFAAAASFVITPLVILFAKKFQFLDFPWRIHPAILHAKPIPRSGGLATFFAIILAYAVAAFFLGFGFIDKHIIGILLAALIIVVVGVLDDKYDLNPYLRLLTNIIAAGLIVAFGVGITWVTNPFGGQIRLDSIVYQLNFPHILPFGFLAGQHSIILLADIFAFIWIVWVMNSLNWSSGVDGQLPGIATIGLLALGFASTRILASDPNQLAPAALAFISAGAYFGFLFWSFYPQKIMPGYGGAALAGMIIASLSIIAGAKLLTTGLLLIVPIIDGVWAILRRLLRGRSPVWGDKEHLHHQLLSLGWSKRQVVLFYYFISIVFAFLALNLNREERFFAISLGAVVILAFLITLARARKSKLINV
jgi:UDP-GlcNAc:undecaprenyl-phosphate GlcNAc-1-phosphate transferase